MNSVGRRRFSMSGTTSFGENARTKILFPCSIGMIFGGHCVFGPHRLLASTIAFVILTLISCGSLPASGFELVGSTKKSEDTAGCESKVRYFLFMKV